MLTNPNLINADVSLSAAQGDIDNLNVQLTNAGALAANLQSQLDTLNANITSLNHVIAVDDATISELQKGNDSKLALINDLVSGRQNVTVYDDLQNVGVGLEADNKWLDAGGNKANTNPNGTMPHGVATYTLNLNKSGSLKFAPAIGYDNLYFFRRIPLPSSKPTRLVDIREYAAVPTSATQALEIDLQLCWGNQIHNMAYQFNFIDNHVKYFDYNHPSWITVPGIPLPDFTGTVKILAEYEIDNLTTTHKAITLNGVTYPVNITQNATPVIAPNKFTIATQLDTRVTANPTSVLINKIGVRFL